MKGILRRKIEEEGNLNDESDIIVIRINWSIPGKKKNNSERWVGAVLYCTVVYCTVGYRNVLHCATLYCTALY